MKKTKARKRIKPKIQEGETVLESPCFFWAFLLIGVIILLLASRIKDPKEQEVFPLIYDAGIIEKIAALNKLDSPIVGELPKTPWE